MTIRRGGALALLALLASLVFSSGWKRGLRVPSGRGCGGLFNVLLGGIGRSGGTCVSASIEGQAIEGDVGPGGAAAGDDACDTCLKDSALRRRVRVPR